MELESYSKTCKFDLVGEKSLAYSSSIFLQLGLYAFQRNLAFQFFGQMTKRKKIAFRSSLDFPLSFTAISTMVVLCNKKLFYVKF